MTMSASTVKPLRVRIALPSAVYIPAEGSTTTQLLPSINETTGQVYIPVPIVQKCRLRYETTGDTTP